jgi:UDP-N-acetylglucosamine transferase subunit ALG13
MILVTTGSSGGPFDRLLATVDRFGIDEEIVVQHGPSSLRPQGATCVDFVPFEQLRRLVSHARVVVSHAGVGSILLCLSSSRGLPAFARSWTITSLCLRDALQRSEL